MGTENRQQPKRAERCRDATTTDCWSPSPATIAVANCGRIAAATTHNKVQSGDSFLVDVPPAHPLFGVLKLERIGAVTFSFYHNAHMVWSDDGG